ncbi:hypothetical protein FB451DRAFT_177733 [Mycena latifolia]|nr:hypothetical protein FB451DRAFT_177733 [Mycena latifolia]
MYQEVRNLRCSLDNCAAHFSGWALVDHLGDCHAMSYCLALRDDENSQVYVHRRHGKLDCLQIGCFMTTQSMEALLEHLNQCHSRDFPVLKCYVDRGLKEIPPRAVVSHPHPQGTPQNPPAIRPRHRIVDGARRDTPVQSPMLGISSWFSKSHPVTSSPPLPPSTSPFCSPLPASSAPSSSPAPAPLLCTPPPTAGISSQRTEDPPAIRPRHRIREGVRRDTPVQPPVLGISTLFSKSHLVHRTSSKKPPTDSKPPSQVAFSPLPPSSSPPPPPSSSLPLPRSSSPAHSPPALDTPPGNANAKRSKSWSICDRTSTPHYPRRSPYQRKPAKARLAVFDLGLEDFEDGFDPVSFQDKLFGKPRVIIPNPPQEPKLRFNTPAHGSSSPTPCPPERPLKPVWPALTRNTSDSPPDVSALAQDGGRSPTPSVRSQFHSSCDTVNLDIDDHGGPFVETTPLGIKPLELPVESVLFNKSTTIDVKLCWIRKLSAFFHEHCAACWTLTGREYTADHEPFSICSSRIHPDLKTTATGNSSLGFVDMKPVFGPHAACSKCWLPQITIEGQRPRNTDRHPISGPHCTHPRPDALKHLAWAVHSTPALLRLYCRDFTDRRVPLEITAAQWQAWLAIEWDGMTHLGHLVFWLLRVYGYLQEGRNFTRY